MSQHTQGPWIINTDPRYPNEPCVDAIIDGVIWHIALCHNAAGPEDDAAEANARLIAAAPDLLAALKDVLPLLRAELDKQTAAQAQSHGVDSIALRTARVRYEAAAAALARAEGTTHARRRSQRNS